MSEVSRNIGRDIMETKEKNAGKKTIRPLLEYFDYAFSEIEKVEKAKSNTRVSFESALQYALKAGVDFYTPGILGEISGFFAIIAAVVCFAAFYVSNIFRGTENTKSLVSAVKESWSGIDALMKGDYKTFVDDLEDKDFALLSKILTSGALERVYYDNKDNVAAFLKLWNKAQSSNIAQTSQATPAAPENTAKTLMQALAGKNLSPLFDALGGDLREKSQSKLNLLLNMDDLLGGIDPKQRLFDVSLHNFLGNIKEHGKLENFITDVLFESIKAHQKEYFSLLDGRAKIFAQNEALDKKQDTLTKSLAELNTAYLKAVKEGKPAEIEAAKEAIEKGLESKTEISKEILDARNELSKDLAMILVDLVGRIESKQVNLKKFLAANHAPLVEYIAQFIPEPGRAALRAQLMKDDKLLSQVIDLAVIALKGDDKELAKLSEYLSTFVVAKSKYEQELEKAEAVVVVAEPGKFVPEAFEHVVNNVLDNIKDPSVQAVLNFGMDGLAAELKISESSLTGPLQRLVQGLNLKDGQLQKFMQDAMVPHLSAMGSKYKDLLDHAKVVGKEAVEFDKGTAEKTKGLEKLNKAYAAAVKEGKPASIAAAKTALEEGLKQKVVAPQELANARKVLGVDLAVILVDLVGILKVSNVNLKEFLKNNNAVLVEYIAQFIPEPGRAALRAQLMKDDKLLSQVIDLAVIALKGDDKELAKLSEYLSTFVVAKSKYEQELEKAEVVVAVAEPGKFMPEAFEQVVNNVLDNIKDPSVQAVLNFGMDGLAAELKISESSLTGPLQKLVQGLKLEGDNLQQFMKGAIVPHLANTAAHYKNFLDHAKTVAQHSKVLEEDLKSHHKDLLELSKKYDQLVREASTAETPVERQAKYDERDAVLRQIRGLIAEAKFIDLRQETEKSRMALSQDLAAILVDLGAKLKVQGTDLSAFMEQNKGPIIEYIVGFVPQQNREALKAKMQEPEFFKEVVNVLSAALSGSTAQDLEKLTYSLTPFLVVKSEDEILFEKTDYLVKNVLEKDEFAKLKLQCNNFKELYKKWEGSKDPLLEKQMDELWVAIEKITKDYPQIGEMQLEHVPAERRQYPRIDKISKVILPQLEKLMPPFRFDLVPVEYKPLVVGLMSANQDSISAVMSIVPDVLNVVQNMAVAQDPEVKVVTDPNEFGYTFAIDDTFKNMLQGLLFKDKNGKPVFNKKVLNGMLKPLLLHKQQEMENFGKNQMNLLDKLGQGIGNISNVGLLPGIKQLVELIISDKDLREFVKLHPTELSAAIKYSLNFFNQDLEWNGVDKKIFDILDVLLEKPEALMPILDLLVRFTMPKEGEIPLSNLEMAKEGLNAIKILMNDDEIGPKIKNWMNQKEIKDPLEDLVHKIVPTTLRSLNRTALSYNFALQPFIERLFENISPESVALAISSIDGLVKSIDNVQNQSIKGIATDLYKNMGVAYALFNQYRNETIYLYTEQECDILRTLFAELSNNTKPGQKDLITEMLALYDKLPGEQKKILLREKIASGYFANAEILNPQNAFLSKPFVIPENTLITDCSFGKSKFYNATFGAGSTLDKVEFDGIEVAGAMNLSGTKLSEVSFTGVKIDSLDLSGAEIGAGCALKGAIIAKLNLQKAKLKGVSFAGAKISEVDLRDTEIPSDFPITQFAYGTVSWDGAKMDISTACAWAEQLNKYNASIWVKSYSQVFKGDNIELTSDSNDVNDVCKQLEKIATAVNVGQGGATFSAINLPKMKLGDRELDKLKNVIAKLNVDKLVIGDREFDKDKIIGDTAQALIKAQDDPTYTIFVKSNLNSLLKGFSAIQLMGLDKDELSTTLSNKYNQLPKDSYLFNDLEEVAKEYLDKSIGQGKVQGRGV